MAISKLMFSDQATGPKMNENLFFISWFIFRLADFNGRGTCQSMTSLVQKEGSFLHLTFSHESLMSLCISTCHSSDIFVN